MKFMLNIMLLFFGLAGMNAQIGYTFKGKVLDLHNNTPLNKARVTFGNDVRITGDDGSFSFKNLSSGNYQLTVSHPKCETLVRQIRLEGDLRLDLRLEHHAEEIEEVTLHGIHKQKEAVVVKTLKQEELQRNSEENLGNILKNMSGVGGLKTGNTIVKPIIHGMYGSRIAILSNGVKLAEQEWGAEHAPNVDPAQFEHIDVIKGASALKYGSDAIGGVVLMLPEPAKKVDTLHGTANLAGISNGRGISADLKLVKSWKNRWSVSAAGGFRKTGDLSAPEYNLRNTGQQFHSFAFSLQKNEVQHGLAIDYRLTAQEIGIFRDSHIGNLEDFYAVINTGRPLYTRDFSYKLENPKQNVAHHLVKLSSYKRVANLGKFSFDYNFQFNHRQEFDLRRGELAALPSLDLELFTNQLNFSHLIERNKKSLETGIDLSYQYNYSTPQTMARRLVPNYSKYAGGIYSVFKVKLRPKFDAEVGARFDLSQYKVKKWYDEADWQRRYSERFEQFYVRTEGNRVFTQPVLDFSNFSVSTGLHWSPLADFNLKFNYAKVGRTPNIAELFADGLHHSAAIMEVGDLGLKNETGNQFNLQAELKLPVMDGLQLSANPYFFVTKNFINQIPTGVQNTIRGVFPVWTYEQIDARMAGFDFEADLQLTARLRYRGQFSWVRGQDETHGQPLPMMVPPNFRNFVEFNDKKRNNFYVRIENETVLQQKNYPRHDPQITVFEDGNEVERTLDLSTPPPAYTMWNFQTGVELTKKLSVGLKITNLFNTSYRDYLNRLRYFSDESGRNFTVNLRYQF